MARPATYDKTTRDALLLAAGRILSTEGAAALTMRRLASEVAATTRAIYALFGSKQEVLRAMYREGFDGLARRLAEVEEDDPVERVRALAFAYRRAARERPHLYQVMFACPVPEFTPSEEDEALGLATLMTLRDAVAAALHAGAIRGDADTITVGMWAVMHGLTSLELNGSLDVNTTADVVWNTTMAAALGGLHP
ncbi:TetR/AcrR family transcriptional regulator [Nonomuraea basaltis]|uniref:TetR/AcrR family transcriptional regulator n=1 Tax=Nonomuraea basaltis TaxID=2495887 RepID=UPI00110C52E4|nr:TetR/AcrR family transcriptional regulator [Nonomuraea basaltis]TMR98874.1 TetR/AcrR family transcriptional regulator [Nonomuraea basaltis]